MPASDHVAARNAAGGAGGYALWLTQAVRVWFLGGGRRPVPGVSEAFFGRVVSGRFLSADIWTLNALYGTHIECYHRRHETRRCGKWQKAHRFWEITDGSVDWEFDGQVVGSRGNIC